METLLNTTPFESLVLTILGHNTISNFSLSREAINKSFWQVQISIGMLLDVRRLETHLTFSACRGELNCETSAQPLEESDHILHSHLFNSTSGNAIVISIFYSLKDVGRMGVKIHHDTGNPVNFHCI
jgi:hypothetical protein